MVALNKVMTLPGVLFSTLDGVRGNLAAPIVVLSKWEKSSFFKIPSRGADMVRDMESVSDVITAFGFFRDLGKLTNKGVDKMQYAQTLNSCCKWLNYLASRKVFQWSGATKGYVESVQSISGIFVAGTRAYQAIETYNNHKNTVSDFYPFDAVKNVSFLAFEVLQSPWFKRDSGMLELCALTIGVFAGLTGEVVRCYQCP